MTPSTISKLSMRPAAIELHDATEDEAVFVGAQAADVGRELLRQHGDGAIGEVDAGAAQAGFEIESGVGLNVLGHVGDVDLEFVAGAVGALADENGVVEVARGFAVDGDDGQRAEVGAGGRLRRVEMCDGCALRRARARERCAATGACGSSSPRRRRSRRASRGFR